MKVMRTLLTAALLLLFFQNYAQTLRGVVRDAATGESLAGAQLSLRAAPGLTPVVTHSDSSGAYVFSALKPGYYLLEVDYDGYQPMLVWDVDIVAGKETVLDVAYNQLYSLPELSISARAEQGHRPMPILGVAPLSGVQTERVPATFFDPARLAQAYPGVSGSDDQANGLIVRGNSPAALRWRLEGLDVVNPNHLPNAGTIADRPVAAAGGVLMFSAQLLDQSALLTGSQPTGYGDAIAGTMDIRLRPGNDQRREFTAQAGLLGLDVAAEGPLTGRGKSSYLVNYRYSTVGLLGQMGINFGDESITFQDLSVHLAAPHTRAGDFRLFAMWGNSANYFEHKPDSAAIETSKDIFNIDYTSKTLIVGASWYKKLSARGWIRAAHIHSGQTNERVAESGGVAFGEFQKDYSDEEIASTALSLGHQLTPGLRLEEGFDFAVDFFAT
ncbi:MAG TPA: carboxypeptidase-like regulatory domain-containing protein, partial [Saprospiraceae bacterium]|nr:carboxypeptidase-like regulatory domain-containing protein [Saprospiraceae bacterium]